MVPSPPHVIPHPLRQKQLWAAEKMSIPSLALFNQSVKVRFCKIFLLVQNFFTTSSKIGVSKNSKFEFLEPKSTIKGGLPSSFTGASEKWERRSRNIQKQSRNKEKNNLRSGKEFEVGILDVEALVCCSTEGKILFKYQFF
ncbi:hypothetical protein MTR67_031374 [Solanum verrucosum]|uniref:Uncharacterized protein n=1 Tax=Solanum verrucosum TaxID=315347 RepID=A0AAF0U2I1_SOLVR|nr:hypothetical protein MTR67_031374 [Solanum verrucosum]